MAKGDNWTKDSTQKSIVSAAEKVLKKAKLQEAQKVYKKVKISDTPLTYKLVEIKPDEKDTQ